MQAQNQGRVHHQNKSDLAHNTPIASSELSRRSHELHDEATLFASALGIDVYDIGRMPSSNFATDKGNHDVSCPSMDSGPLQSFYFGASADVPIELEAELPLEEMEESAAAFTSSPSYTLSMPLTRDTGPRLLRILVADDFKGSPSQTRKTFEWYLRRPLLPQLVASYDIACHGYEAIQMAHATDYDIIFISEALKDVTAYEVAASLIQMDIKSPLVLITIESNVDAEEAASKGFDAILLRPLSVDRISGLIRALCLGEEEEEEHEAEAESIGQQSSSAYSQKKQQQEEKSFIPAMPLKVTTWIEKRYPISSSSSSLSPSSTTNHMAVAGGASHFPSDPLFHHGKASSSATSLVPLTAASLLPMPPFPSPSISHQDNKGAEEEEEEEANKPSLFTINQGLGLGMSFLSSKPLPPALLGPTRERKMIMSSSSFDDIKQEQQRKVKKETKATAKRQSPQGSFLISPEEKEGMGKKRGSKRVRVEGLYHLATNIDQIHRN